MPVDAPRRVLIVEDDQEIREILTTILVEAGYAVASAANGLEALTQLRSGVPLPAVILLDLLMPVMDGVEFCARKDADAAIKDIPVVVMSALRKPEVKVPTTSAQGTLKKPMTLDAVLEAVKRFCS
jgi:CheY-like chemotaxis protein